MMGCEHKVAHYEFLWVINHNIKTQILNVECFINVNWIKDLNILRETGLYD